MFKKLLIVFLLLQSVCFGANNVNIVSPIESNGAIPVKIQDQTSELIDLYVCKQLATTNLQESVSAGEYIVTVNDSTGAEVYDCINIIENGRIFQSLISTVNSNVIYFSSPLDKDFTTDAVVCFGEWDMSTTDGSSNPVSFILVAPTGQKIDIYGISISMEDNAVMYESKFGGIDQLPNGLVARVTDGIKKNLFLVSTNSGFREYGFVTEYPDKVPAGTYAFWADKNYNQENGAIIRLDGNTGDYIELINSDDLTDIGKIAITIHGHYVTD